MSLIQQINTEPSHAKKHASNHISVSSQFGLTPIDNSTGKTMTNYRYFHSNKSFGL